MARAVFCILPNLTTQSSLKTKLEQPVAVQIALNFDFHYDKFLCYLHSNWLLQVFRRWLIVSFLPCLVLRS